VRSPSPRLRLRCACAPPCRCRAPRLSTSTLALLEARGSREEALDAGAVGSGARAGFGHRGHARAAHAGPGSGRGRLLHTRGSSWAPVRPGTPEALGVCNARCACWRSWRAKGIRIRGLPPEGPTRSESGPARRRPRRLNVAPHRGAALPPRAPARPLVGGRSSRPGRRVRRGAKAEGSIRTRGSRSPARETADGRSAQRRGEDDEDDGRPPPAEDPPARRGPREGRRPRTRDDRTRLRPAHPRFAHFARRVAEAEGPAHRLGASTDRGARAPPPRGRADEQRSPRPVANHRLGDPTASRAVARDGASRPSQRALRFVEIVRSLRPAPTR
jgi:hypothetical protein